MSNFAAAKDTISGREGEIYFVFPGAAPEKVAYVRTIEATADKNKTDINLIGKRATQRKANGWSGSGSMTLYYATTKFRKMMSNYMSKGEDVYFDIRIRNTDPTSAIGEQDVTLINCNADSVTLAKMSADDEVLDEDIAFTFDDYKINKSFS